MRIVHILLSVFMLWGYPTLKAQKIFIVTRNELRGLVECNYSNLSQMRLSQFALDALNFMEAEAQKHGIEKQEKVLDEQTFYLRVFMHKFYKQVYTKKRPFSKRVQRKLNRFIQVTKEYPMYGIHDNSDKWVVDSLKLIPFDLNTNWKEVVKHL